MDIKACTICRQELALTEFHKHASAKDGRQRFHDNSERLMQAIEYLGTFAVESTV